MDNEYVDLEEAAGDTAEMQITTVSAGETESILVVLTSIFLFIAISMLALKLYWNYDLWKDPGDLKNKENAIKTSVK